MTGSTHVSAKDISLKWSRFSDSEAAAIKSVEGLSAQVVKTYSVNKAKAEAEVKTWMVGRTF